jgi:hypothetical protein
MFTRAQVRDDRALERGALRKIVEAVRRDPMKYEPHHVGIAVVARADELEAALKLDDVRVRREILGELRI